MATNKDGSPCRARPRPGTDRCPWHSPAFAGERAGWAKKGGASRSNTARARRALALDVLEPAEIQGLLGVVLKGVIAGRIEPGIATAAANVSRAIVAVREATQLEERVAELEALASGRRSA